MSDGQQGDPGELLEGAVDVALKAGPLILEAWVCEHCHVETFRFHKFQEVIACAKCGHRIASKVELYRHAMEEAADNGGSGNVKPA